MRGAGGEGKKTGYAGFSGFLGETVEKEVGPA